MSCTYTFADNGCFLEITRVMGLDTRLERQFNLSTISWVERAGNVIELRDGDGNAFNADIGDIPAFANIPALIAYLEPLRAACTLVSGGGGAGFIPIPTGANTTVTYAISTGAGLTAAGLWSVSIANIGVADGLVNGVKIIPFQSMEFTGYWDTEDGIFYRLPSITYDGTGTELAITTIL